MTEKQRRALLRAWRARQQAKKYFCALNADWDWHVALQKICGTNWDLYGQLNSPGFHPTMLPGEHERRAALAERAFEIVGHEVDEAEVERVIFEFLESDPLAEDSAVLDYVGSVAHEVGLRPPAEAVERGAFALAVEEIVDETLAGEVLLPEARLRAIAEEFERAADIEELRRRYFADPLQGADPPPLSLGEALALCRDRYWLREGTEPSAELVERWRRRLLGV